MEVALLPGSEPTWSLRIGWDMCGITETGQSFKLASRMAVIGGKPRSCSRFVETKDVSSNVG